MDQVQNFRIRWLEWDDANLNEGLMMDPQNPIKMPNVSRNFRV